MTFEDLQFDELDHKTVRAAIDVLKKMGRSDLAERLEKVVAAALTRGDTNGPK